MPLNEAFESAKFLVEWVKKKIDDFNDISLDYIENGQPYAWIHKEDPQTGHNVLVAKMVSRPPLPIRGQATDIIKNLRDALDQAIWAASIELGNSSNKKATHFPFARNPTDLDDVLTNPKTGRQCRDIPVALHDTIRSFEPYPTGPGYSGGNDLLRKLGTISGPNKHQVALKVGLDINNFTASMLRGEKFIMQVQKISDYEVQVGRVLPEGWLEVNGKFSAFIAFNAPTEVKGLAVSDVFIELVNVVELIVNKLEIDTASLKANLAN